MVGLLDALWRMHQQRSWWNRWSCIDKPARIEAGAGPDGLFPEERSEADKERLGLKQPHEPKPCQVEAAGGRCNCAAMLKNRGGR